VPLAPRSVTSAEPHYHSQAQIAFRGRDRFLGLRLCDQGDVVKSIVPLAAHTVEEGKGRSQRRVEMLLRGYNHRAMMAKLDPGSASVAQHQSKRPFEH
jgi:hypothetical protein